MNEPKYDEDVVNLGYLKKAISGSEENIEKKYENVSKHYGSKPNTPYYKGDTWIDEKNNVYTCINTREIGSYNEADWVSESGAKEEAESKNKIYLTKPSDYSVGDMWILQSDSDHKAGKKGEILISIAGRKNYNENDWINMLSYGNISSINEVSNNLNEAINRIGIVEKSIEDGLITTYYQAVIPESNCIGDLWYVTETLDGYIKGKIYRYDGTTWKLLDDPEITEAFEKANEARIVADGKIQSFYSEIEPTEDIGVGDLWIDISDKNKLYRHNGTNWVPIYDTRIDEVIENVEFITERQVEISTDLGKIRNTVSETTTKVSSLEDTTLKNVEVQYALSDSTTVVPTSGWSTTAPEWQSEKYMWQKTISTYHNGTTVESEPTCIQGAKGERGLQGLQGDKGEQGIQGPKGDTGAKGDKGDTGATGSTGAKGEKGDKGDTGDSGATTYFHIKYSPVSNPTSSQMSETPNSYIGTYVDFIEEDSSDPTKYTWFQFKGSQGEKGEKGIAGTNGTDGKTSYLHIAYANNSSGTSGFSVSDSKNKTYIGQYTDFEENDSTDPTKYFWTKIKGDTGNAGKGVKSVTNTYQAGSSGTTAPTGTWSTSIPKTTADKPYLWTMTVTTYTDGTTTTAYAIGATPEGITVGGRNYILKSNKFIASTGCGAGITNSIEDEIWKIVTVSGNSNYLSFSKENTIEDNFKDDDEFTFSVEIKCDEGSTGKPTIYFKSGMGYYNMIGEVSTEYSTLYYTGKWKSANEIRFHLGWSSTVGTFYIRRIKFEKGNKVTDWTPAPEDIESSIEGVQTEANEALMSAGNAQTIADKAMTAVDQLSRIISELVTDANGTSMMTQTSKGWTFNMSSITDNIEALRDGLDTLNNNQGSTSDLLYKIRDLVDSIDKKTAYINIGTDDSGNPCIELGKADNDFKVRITNTAIDFMEGSTKIAYANNNTFYVEKMIVKNELQIGESLGFVWRTRANGNLGLVPISQ